MIERVPSPGRWRNWAGILNLHDIATLSHRRNSWRSTLTGVSSIVLLGNGSRVTWWKNFREHHGKREGNMGKIEVIEQVCYGRLLRNDLRPQMIAYPMRITGHQTSPASSSQKTNARISTLCLGGPWSNALWKEVCGTLRACPSSLESYILKSNASSGVI